MNLKLHSGIGLSSYEYAPSCVTPKLIPLLQHRLEESGEMTLTDEHKEVSHRFIQQADEELERGDQLQASEKAWGAAVRAVKSIAERRGWEHDNHRHLFTAARRIAEETDDTDIRRLFGVANSLHINFYEGWMDLETVTAGIEDVKLLLHKLESVENFPI